jgi:hypothetical protein
MISIPLESQTRERRSTHEETGRHGGNHAGRFIGASPGWLGRGGEHPADAQGHEMTLQVPNFSILAAAESNMVPR